MHLSYAFKLILYSYIYVHVKYNFIYVRRHIIYSVHPRVWVHRPLTALLDPDSLVLLDSEEGGIGSCSLALPLPCTIL